MRYNVTRTYLLASIAPKHHPAIVKITLKAAAILSPGHCVSVSIVVLSPVSGLL